MKNGTESIPEFFKAVTIPAVAKWTEGKLKFTNEEPLVVDGVEYTIRRWAFEGAFPRHVLHFHQEWMMNDGAEWHCSVRCHGGTYRGQKPTVLVVFTEYAPVREAIAA